MQLHQTQKITKLMRVPALSVDRLSTIVVSFRMGHCEKTNNRDWCSNIWIRCEKP
uniref:Uncharacterized protein n=1 Tax=Anguilla anguilla TaxID=7936 RepID=A0A0E9WC86_ANGAN